MRKAIFYILMLSLLSSACGRKAPPTLRPFEKPPQPEKISAIHNEKGLIISWSYPEKKRAGIKGFILLRSDNSDFKRIAYVDNKEGALTFTDTSFTTGKTYRYRVIVESLKGVLSDAIEIKATPASLPRPPQNPRFNIKDDLIELSWDDDKTCYNIYRAYEGENYSLINEKPLCSAPFTDRVLPDRPIQYILRSVTITDIINEGAPSEVIHIRPEHYIPSPPSDIRLIPEKDRVFILWRESPEVWVRGYRIYRKVEGEENFRLIGESPIPAFTDTTIEDLRDKKIFYMIKSVGPSLESPPLLGTVELRFNP